MIIQTNHATHFWEHDGKLLFIHQKFHDVPWPLQHTFKNKIASYKADLEQNIFFDRQNSLPALFTFFRSFNSINFDSPTFNQIIRNVFKELELSESEKKKHSVK